MRMRGYGIYMSSGFALGCIFDDPKPNCILLLEKIKNFLQN